MASILMLTKSATHASPVNTKAALESKGHTVTVTSASTASGLDAAWGSGHDLIVGLRYERTEALRAWVEAKWDAGVPIMLGLEADTSGGFADHFMVGYDLIREPYVHSASSGYGVNDLVQNIVAHPITTGFTPGSTVQVMEGANFGIDSKYTAGTPLGNADSFYDEINLAAFDVGDSRYDTAPSVPARAVFCGWLYGGQSDYTVDGKTLLGQAVDWLASTAVTGPAGQAATSHAWATTAAGRAPRSGVATVPHAWTPAATGENLEPGRGAATVSHAWTPTAEGDDTEPKYGTATVGHQWTPAATGADGETVGGTGGVSHSWATTAEGDNGETELDGWDADRSQQAVLDVTGPDTNPAGPLLIDRAPAPAPATITERPIMRHSPQALPEHFTVDPSGSVHSRGLWDITEAPVGVPHVWVDGVDITYLRDAPVTLDSITASEPGGWESATLTLPQVSVWETPGVGDLTWLRPGAQIEAYLIAPDGTKVEELFSGHLVDDGAQATESDVATVWECAGDFSQAFYYLHRPPTSLDPTDLGDLIPGVLNGVVSRRYGTIAPVPTGMVTRSRGSGDDYVGEYVSELLSAAWTLSSRQWTIARTDVARQYEMRLKDTTTAHWTVTPGTPGISIDLHADASSRVDAVMGRGIGPDGYAWSGREWPAMLDYDPPDFPNTNAANTITVGESDADTDSGDGISTWEARAADLGFNVTVDGHFSASDSDIVRQVQRRMGAQVDGIIGPQTWNATWDVGINAAALESIRLPLALRSEVEPHLRSGNGAILGDNPDYDPGVIRRERAIDYGAQVTKREGTLSAQREVDRSQQPGWVGTITLAADPHEGSRFTIREGQNVRVLGWRGTDLLAHVAKVTFDMAGGAVALSVDTKARDAMTLASIKRRDRDAQIDPARRPGNITRKSRQDRDVRVTFEGDSPAGRIHRRGLFAGLWSVFPIPVSEAGEIVKLDVHTESPKAQFSLGFFASPVQPSHLKRLVGNPQADSSAWRAKLPQLEDLGFIEAWGAGESMAGHWPDQEGPVTGRHIDTGGWSYTSNAGGWVWVAAWSPVSTFIEGRVYPGPID